MPPLQRQVVEIPVLKGMDEGIDRRVLPADRWTRLENVVVDYAGAAHKRPGYAALPNTTKSAVGAQFPSSIEWLDTRGPELLARGPDEVTRLDHIYSWSPGGNFWKDVDYATTCAFEISNVTTITTGAVLPRVCVTSNGYEVWIYSKTVGGNFPNVVVRDVNTHAVILPETDMFPSYNWEMAKIVAVGGFACLIGTNAGTGQTEIVSYDPSSAIPPTAVPTALFAANAPEIWDVCEVGGGQFAAVFAGPLANDLTIAIYSHLGTLLDSRVTAQAANVKRVSIAAQQGIGFRVCYQLANNDVIVNGYASAAGLPLSWSTTIANPGFLQAYVSVGMTPGGRSVGIYQKSVLVSTGVQPIFTQELDSAGAFDPTLFNETANTMLRSKPFAFGERIYVIASPFTSSSFLSLELTNTTTALPGGRGWGVEGIFGDGSAWLAQYLELVTADRPLFAEVPAVGVFKRLYPAELRTLPLLDLLTTNSYVAGVTFDFEVQSACPLGVQYQDCVARSGSQVSWYDGEQECELSFLQRPIVTARGGGVGAVPAGNYGYVAVYQWIDSQGNLHQSEPSSQVDFTAAGGTSVDLKITTLGSTRKGRDSQGKSRDVQIALFRTDNNGQILFQLTPPNGGVVNDPTAVTVAYNDNDPLVSADDYGEIYTSGDILANTTLPGSTCVQTFGSRLWVADASDGKTLWFSKFSVVNEAPGFSRGLTLRVDDAIDSVVAMGSMDDKLIVFTGSRIYYVSGDGPNDTGNGGSFNGPNRIAADSGCVDARSVCSVPDGVFYASPAGIFHVDRSLTISAKGLPVLDETTGCTYLGTILDPVGKRVLFLVTGGTNARYAGPRWLVYDYSFDIWTIWIPYVNVPFDGGFVPQPDPSLTAQAILDGKQYKAIIPTNRANVQLQGGLGSFTDNGAWFSSFYESPWIHLSGIAGYQRAYRVTVTGQKLSDHIVQVDVLTDYDEDTVQQTRSWDASTLNSLPVERVQLHIRPQLCSAIKIRVSDFGVDRGIGTGPIGGFDLAGLAFEVGVKGGSPRLSPLNRG